MPAATPAGASPKTTSWPAALASLTDADAPPDEQDHASWPDPDTGRPVELAGADHRGAGAADRRGPGCRCRRSIPAGCLPPDGTGRGVPGSPTVARWTCWSRGCRWPGSPTTRTPGWAAVSDDELIGVLRGWWRQTSWAQARALAAIAELARRRPADRTPPASARANSPSVLSEFIPDEIAMALTLTEPRGRGRAGPGAGPGRPPGAPSAALEAGPDRPAPGQDHRRGCSARCPPAHADAVEAAGAAPTRQSMTTGQLRAALQRAVLSVDPDAARRRREEAEQEARVEHWADPEGTASLAGRCLPPAAALTASSRLTQIAAAWKKHGAQGGMDLLRAHAYLALLNGQPIDDPPACACRPRRRLPAAPGRVPRWQRRLQDRQPDRRAGARPR